MRTHNLDLETPESLNWHARQIMAEFSWLFLTVMTVIHVYFVSHCVSALLLAHNTQGGSDVGLNDFESLCLKIHEKKAMKKRTLSRL